MSTEVNDIVSNYIKIQTDNKKEAMSVIDRIIEKESGYRINIQKSNGEYVVEAIKQQDEPPISFS